MTPLEHDLSKFDGDQFWNDCVDTFGSQCGQRVLQVIVQLCPITLPPTRATPEETHIQIGRNELAMLLWRRSQRTIEPQDAPKPNP